MIYLYQLQSSSTVHMSLMLEIDVHFWLTQGERISWVGQTTSMNLAQQVCKKPSLKNKICSLDPTTLTQSKGHSYSLLAEQMEDQLAGRSLFYEEVFHLMKKHQEYGSHQDHLAAIQHLYLQKRVTYRPGIEWGNWAITAYCHRCSAKKKWITPIRCARCETACVMCHHCSLLGRSTACKPLMIFAPKRLKTNLSLQSVQEHELTPWQEAITQDMDHILFGTRQNRLLLWAVTGAGKTECMVPGITKYLQAGERVLWVTPRQDVVKEIAPRLKKVFPQCKVVALYGGSPDRFEHGSLVIATAQQVMRYQAAFELGIVDEVDAFPLYGNPLLSSIVQRALSPSAKQIYLTATPPKECAELVRQDKLSMLSLPIRYHGHPLPIPKIKREQKFWRRIYQLQSIPSLMDFIHRVKQTDGQAFLFVPRVKDVFFVCDWLEQACSLKDEVAGVYAQDEERESKIHKFRQEKICFLVTTTILERGVTMKRSHVAVLGADHRIFDQTALIQIAGRVGRSADYQKGQICFYAEEKTVALKQTLHHLRQRNQEAEKEGFLTKKWYTQW